MSYKLVTDSSANLPADKIVKYGITVVPFTYIIDGEEHTVDPFATEEAQKEFFDKMREKAEITTSLINSARFIEYFEPILEAGDDILYVGMAAGISGTFTNAMIAAEEMKEKYPERTIELVDSKNASMGEGLLALIGARMLNKGVELFEAAERLRKTVPHLRGMFMVDDIMYLRRTGRVSGFTAVAGKTIHGNLQAIAYTLQEGRKQGRIVLQQHGGDVILGICQRLCGGVDHLCDGVDESAILGQGFPGNAKTVFIKILAQLRTLALALQDQPIAAVF